MTDQAPVSSAKVTPDHLRRTVAAVVPCYNPGDRVKTVIEGLGDVLDHVIVVDDGSTEDLSGCLQEFNVQMISFPVNRGKGHALLEGFRQAKEIEGVECIVTIDSDGQHDPNEIPRLYDAFRASDAGIVIGSRMFDKETVPWRSRVGNKMTVAITGMLLGIRLPDTQSGFRLHSLPLVEYLLGKISGGRYETEMEILIRAHQAGYHLEPVPIRTIYEPGNKSSHFHVFRDSFLVYRKLFGVALLG